MPIHDKLLKFSSKNISVSKDSINPHFHSKYASLTNILGCIKPVLNELKITITHSLGDGGVTTQIIDTEDGSSVESVFPVFGSKPQEIGSSITYARRYSIGALLDLDIDDDDDGNGANDAKRTEFKQMPSGAMSSKLWDIIEEIKNAITLDQLKELYEQGKQEAKTEKQIAWLNREVNTIKSSLQP